MASAISSVGRRVRGRTVDLDPWCPTRRSSMSMVAPTVAARERMLARPWWPEAPDRRRIESVPVVLDPKPQPAVRSGARPQTIARVAPEWRATLLQRLVDDAEQVRGRRRVGLVVHRRRHGARHRSSSCGGTPRRSAASPSISVVPLSSSGRSPKMKFRMSRIVRWRLSIARSTRRSTSSGSSRTSSGTSSSERPDRVEVLDDAVVEVLADALALVDDRQALDLLVQPGVLDRDPGVDRERLDEPLVVLGELVGARLVGQVEVADGAALDGDRDAEEAVHRRVIRREIRGAWGRPRCPGSGTSGSRG